MSSNPFSLERRAEAQPLRKCVLRCDPYMRLLVGGMYGYTRGGGKQFHGGIDLYAEPKTPCFAIGAGTVEWIHDFGTAGWGQAVLARLKAPACWVLYAHLSKTFVKQGARLAPNALIGLTGISGNGDADYPHLHFEAWTSLKAGTKNSKERYRFDPLDLLGPLPFQPFALQAIERNQLLARTA